MAGKSESEMGAVRYWLWLIAGLYGSVMVFLLPSGCRTALAFINQLLLLYSPQYAAGVQCSDEQHGHAVLLQLKAERQLMTVQHEWCVQHCLQQLPHRCCVSFIVYFVEVL